MTRSRKRKLQRLLESKSARAGSHPACRWHRCCWPACRWRTRRTRTQAAILEEVVVTAQKQQENLQAVPMSIQAFGDDEARRAAHQQHDGLPEVHAERVVPERRPGIHRAYSCAAWPAATTATTPARCRASASTSTSSRSRPSRARSTSTSTTSSASRCWPDRRARSTARVPRPARSAPSRTSPIPRNSAPATTCRATSSRTVMPAMSPRASSTCRSTTRRRCASSAGTTTRPVTSTTSRAR